MSGKCSVYSLKWGLRSVKCKVYSVDCGGGMSTVQCPVWSVKCGVQNAAWNVKCSMY